MKKYRVAVIGCGVICSNHIHALMNSEKADLCAVCDIVPEKADFWASKTGVPAFYDYHEMLEKIHPDSVHLCLPHWLHAPVAVDCLNRGIWVLSEKPMNSNLTGALQMVQASEKSGSRLGVIFQNRYNNGSVFARNLIQSGKAGKVISLRAVVCWNRNQQYYDSNGGWRGRYETSGGGVLINQAIHTLDLMRWLSGSEPELVSAGAAHRGLTTVEVEDTAEGFIRFASGATGTFWFTINNSFDMPIELSVTCENCIITLVGNGAKAVFKDGTTLESAEEKVSSVSAKTVYGNSHSLQIDEFYGEDTEAVKETVRQALKTQKLLADIFHSAHNENPHIPEME